MMNELSAATPHEQDSWKFRWRGGVGIAILGLGAALTLLSPLAAAEGSWLDLFFELLAWPLFIGGIALRFWSTLYIGGRKGCEVVSDGPYSMTRNPLYLGSLMLACSAGLFLGSVVFTLATLLMASFYVNFTIPTEERSLSARLGAPYYDYCQRVPRFWPAWRSYRSVRRIDVELRALRHEAKSAAGYCWIPVIGELVQLLRTQPWWPHILHLP